MRRRVDRFSMLVGGLGFVLEAPSRWPKAGVLGSARLASRRRLGLSAILPVVAVSGLVLACFGSLVIHPDHLIVDGQRPSIDEFQRIEPREVGNDLTQLFLPRHQRIADRVALGRWPSSWDSSGFCGRPLVGNPQAGLFYPPVWVAWWSGQASSLGWLTVAHLIWAAVGVFTLCLRSGSGKFASTIAAGTYSVSPYVLAQVFEGHYPHVWGACWYPWAFLAADGLRRGEFWGMLVLPAILATAGLTGHPQEAYYLTLALSGWLAGIAVFSTWKGKARQSLGLLARLAGVAALTIGLSAVELVPDAEAAAWGRKTDRMTLEEASKYHVDPINLTQLLSPDALGGASDYFGRENHWETLLSIGLVPLFLALIGRRSRSRSARAWSILAIVAVVFGAGYKLGLFAILYEIVPGMDRFRVPSRTLFLASLAGAMLAGLGIQRIIDGEIVEIGRRVRLGFLLLGVMLGLGLALSAIQPATQVHALEARPEKTPSTQPKVSASSPTSSTNGGDSRTQGHESRRDLVILRKAISRISCNPLVWLMMGSTMLAMAWLERRPSDARKVAIGLGVLAWMELAWSGSSMLRTAPLSQFLGPDPVAEAIEAENHRGPFRIRARDPFYTDLRAQGAGLEKTNLNDAFQIGRAADFYSALYPILGPFRAVVDRSAMSDQAESFRREVRQAILDRLGVAFVVTDRPLPKANWPVVASGTWNRSNFTIYRNPTAMPRAYVVPRAAPMVEDGSIVSAILHQPPGEAVLLANDPLAGSSGPRQPFAAADYESDDPDRVIVSVETMAPGLLVVTDTWMPGWSATLDGEPVEILRGDHAFRVIPLPRPGRHRVVMRYQAPGLATGLTITAISVLILIGLALGMLRRRLRAGQSFTALPDSRCLTQRM